MLRTDIKGLSVAYQRTGRGPAIVLLHGFIQDSRVWIPQLADLSDRFTVIAWDAPGAGQSSDPPAGFGIGDWADTLAAVLDVETILHAHVVGLSWGGLLAQELYRRYRSRISSLVLVDTYAGWVGSLGEPAAKRRLASCIRDSSLPARDLVTQYLPGMFSDHPPPAIRDRLAAIISDTHPAGFVSWQPLWLRATRAICFPDKGADAPDLGRCRQAIAHERFASTGKGDPGSEAGCPSRRGSRQQPRGGSCIQCDSARVSARAFELLRSDPRAAGW